MKRLDESKLPKHVAIIMDGNRRWAKKNKLSAVGGHNYVVDKVIEPLIERCGELGIPYLTLWAFSTENWKREQKEVKGIMTLFQRALDEKVEGFIEKGARLRVIGDLARFPQKLQGGIKESVEKSEGNKKITVTFALNYGGRDEIVRAVKQIVKSKVNYGEVDEKMVSEKLDTAGMPDPDLIIRTGGSYRMSGFMPWQGVYSEFYFTKVLMPEFTVEELEKALVEYENRERRYGGGRYESYEEDK